MHWVSMIITERSTLTLENTVEASRRRLFRNVVHISGSMRPPAATSRRLTQGYYSHVNCLAINAVPCRTEEVPR